MASISALLLICASYNNCTNFHTEELADGELKLSSSAPDAAISIQFDKPATTWDLSIHETFQILLSEGQKILSVTCQLNSDPAEDCSSKSVTFNNLVGTDYTLVIKATTESGLTATQQRSYHKIPPPPSITEPAWLKGQALNEWFQIPGTKGNGGSAACAFSGMALKESTSEIIIAAAGGHGDSSDNRVVSIRLDQENPTWVQRSAPSTVVAPNVAYYPDGKPASRHTYYSTHYIPQLDRVMLIGAQFVYGAAYTFFNVDGFSLGTNTWDPAGTWKDITTYGKAANTATGDVWTAYGWGVAKWSPTTGVQEPLANVERAGYFLAMQNAWDPVRNQLVSIGFGDGWGYGNFPNLNSYKIDSTGKTVTPITFNPSAGLTTFLAERPVSASLEYDPVFDRFLYFGNNVVGGRIFAIKPNTSSVWDVSILPLGAGSKNPGVTANAGVMSRFRYVPKLKGFVYAHCPPNNEPSDLYFIRTSN